MGKKSKRREATKAAGMAVLNKCHQCGKTDAQTDLSICSGCRLICFCSKDCQTKSWPDHRKKCKAAKAEAEANISPIWEAARYGRNKELSKLLARYPASINLHCPGILGGSTALEIACAEGRPETVQILLDAGASVNIADETFGQLPIHRAAESGSIKTAQMLLDHARDLDHGSEVVIGDGMGQHPLHFAAEHGRPEMIQFLLDNGAKPSLEVLYRNKTPRDWAVMMGHDDCAKLL